MSSAWEKMTGQTGRCGRWGNPGLAQLAPTRAEKKQPRRKLTEEEELARLIERQNRDMKGYRR